MEQETPVEEILDTIGDQLARSVLASVSTRPKSAKELGDELELSLPTVYRRLDVLEDHDLIRSRTAVDDEGTHYKLFECNFDSTVISLEDDEYSVRIYRTEDLPDRFSSLWDDLGRT